MIEITEGLSIPEHELVFTATARFIALLQEALAPVLAPSQASSTGGPKALDAGRPVRLYPILF